MKKLSRISLLALLIALAFGAAASAQESIIDFDPNTLQINLWASGFTRPNQITNAGDGSGRLFVVEQGGRIWILDRDGSRLPNAFLDISARISPEANNLSTYTERGLLGLAFHPDYAENGYFYVNYTDTSGVSVVSRFSVSAESPDMADPASEMIILRQQQPFANHNGGWLDFGPDGYLYISIGDGGSAGDPQRNAQNLQTWLGKILRIDVDSAEPYAVPEDNPFVGTTGILPEIWAYGLRNAWRNSFDRQTGDLYIADVGQNQWEEVNFQPADSAGGENYGWDWMEGSRIFEGNPPSPVVMPFAEYNHTEGVSVTGGYVYRGEAIPGLQGVYLYGDFGTGTIWSAYREGDEWRIGYFKRNTGINIASFGEDEAGELYVVHYSGSIWRLEPGN
jgi:glucose/arabinose dehydrogenase